MKHGIKAKLSALIGFAALLTAVVFLGAQREDTKILELISQEYGPLIDFSIEQDAGIAMVSLSLAPDIPHEARIYYTLDGSVPDATDACYEEPLALPCEDVGKGVTIRAVISYGDQLSPTFTRTVLPLEHAGLPEDLVIVSISTDPANLYDYETGIMVEGKTKDDFIAAGGDYDNLQPWQLPANFKQRGENWIRDGYAEFYDSQGNLLGGRDVGIGIAGGASSYYDIKSLKLFANWNRFGETADFPASWLFPASAKGTTVQAVDSYNKVVVRNGGQDRDGTFLLWNVLSPLAKESGLTHVADAVPAIVYLNGTYYSYMCLQQHVNRDYLGNLYGLDKERIVDNELSTEADLLRITGLGQFLQQDVRDPAVREQVEQIVDVDNLFLYYAFEMVVNNLDWIHNNYRCWRYTGGNIEGNAFSDGRYRFILYDLDVCLRQSPDQFRELLTEESYFYSELLNFLLGDSGYCEKFINIVLNLTNTTLSPETLCARLTEEKEKQIALSQNEKFACFITKSLSETSEEVYDEVCKVALNRKDMIHAHLVNYFSCQKAYTLSILVDAPGSCVRLENMRLAYGDHYAGTYFAECGVTLHPEIGPGQEFDHWLVNDVVYDTQTLYLDAANIGTASSVKVVLITKACRTGKLVINEVKSKGAADWIELRNVGSEPMDLSGICISDDSQKPRKCALPQTTLDPGELLVLLCKNNLTLAGHLVNFNLSTGDYLLLTQEDGTQIDGLCIPNLPEGTSYGLSEQTGQYTILEFPTKGEPNG